MSIFIGIFIPVKKQHMALGRPVNKNTQYKVIVAHLQSSVFKLSKDLIDSIHEEGIVAYTS